MKGFVIVLVVLVGLTYAFEDDDEKCLRKYPSHKDKCNEPCSFSKCDEPGAVCKNGYCGGCNAKWFVKGEISETCTEFYIEKAVKA